MSIDWTSLLDRAGIPYVTRSPNISAGEIGVKCPWCGASDSSEHLAIDERGRGYVCRRNRSHRGKSPVKLIAAIKRIPYEQAERIVGRRMVTPQFAGSSLAKFLKANPDPVTTKNKLRFPDEFKPLKKASGLPRVFWAYMRNRGFDDKEIEWLAEYYNLHYALTGQFAYRLIIPIYDEYGELVNWTGRAVSNDMTPRYRALHESEAIAPGKMLLSSHKLLDGGAKLIICEGPLDAFRVSSVGYSEWIYGTCLFGTNISPEQAVLIHDLSQRFGETYIALDPDARMRIAGMLMRSGLRITALPVPDGVKDPGEMSADQAKRWLKI